MKFKQRTILFSFMALSCLATNSGADVEELMQEAKCYACHDREATLIGPPYNAIALRHQKNKDIALNVLTQKIIHGGGGNWGQVPMVPNEQLSEDQARSMAEWILNVE